ncbi:HNH endonuclease [Candidatus Pelagibacter sp. Uisw_121]|jgi:hypothetical protein|uniref:HNH endonuclease family protein n=1 Tax=Candidatus Pelagibacter sp. Uisw_121 TaxID=3230987 RepID=UPI0039EB94BE
MKVKELYNQIVDGKITSDIELQREIIYTKEKQKLVIDSIIRKIPLPAFYFWKRGTKLEVLDGKQRIEAIKLFKQNLLEYNDTLWRDTNSRLQKIVDDTELKTIITSGPDSLKREIFRRINTLGEALSKYEVLNGLHHGQYLRGLKTYVTNDNAAVEIFGGNKRGGNQYKILNKIMILNRKDQNFGEISEYLKRNKNKSFNQDKTKVGKYIKFIFSIFENYKEFDIYFDLAKKYLNDRSIWSQKKDIINKNITKYLKSDYSKLTDKSKEIEDIIITTVKNISTDPKRLFTVDDKKNLLRDTQKNDDGKYPCCDCPNQFLEDELTVDHKKPWSKGGPTVLSNAQLLCRPCNSKKGNKYFI